MSARASFGPRCTETSTDLAPVGERSPSAQSVLDERLHFGDTVLPKLVDGHAIRLAPAQPQAAAHQLSLPVLRESLAKDEPRKHEEQSALAQAIIESAPVSMIATDLNGTITAMNSAAERLTLYRGRELIGEHSLILLHDAVQLSAYSTALAHRTEAPISAGFEALAASVDHDALAGHEWVYLRKDGSRVWVDVTMKGLYTRSGVKAGYLAMAFDVTERKALADSVQHVTHHDQLTGLPNRLLLNDRLSQGIERANRFGKKLAVYMIDIDHFARINQSLGHSGGDTLLKYVAKQLQGSVRRTDTVARVDGDEFVVIMPDFRDDADAERCAALMQQEVATPVLVGDREVRVTASIGFCLYPDGAANATDLLRHADAAMKAAKATGRANQQAYLPSSQKQKVDRLELEQDLRYALANDELFLEYQPQVDLASGAVTGMEALLRWRCPKRGIVAPLDFIPIAEETGLMIPISEWVFKKACYDCVDLQGELGLPLVVAVNLSPRQFSQRNLPSLVSETLRLSRLAPKCLELEITEQTLMVSSEDTLGTLQAIRELGVGLAIDDFGTGFSSFSYILQYQVDRIKIDRSFIARALDDANAMAVVRSIIAMAHGLNMGVVAEGVETPAQRAYLARRRCAYAQGYLYSRPVSKADFPAAVRRIMETVVEKRAPVKMPPASSRPSAKLSQRVC